MGINVSLMLALTPSTFPTEQIDQTTDTCARGNFISSGYEYSVFGLDVNSPPRWALSEQTDRIAYLAVGPPPSAAFDWYAETGGSGAAQFSEPPVYIVAVTDGDFRDVYAFLKAMPSDKQLMELFRDSLSGTSKRLLRFNAQTANMEITSQPNDW